MKYNHLVKYNGVYYPAGTDVPVGETPSKKVAKEEVKEELNEIKEERAYTKTEINRMSTAELKALAIECEIEDVEDMTGGELKKVLIEKFGL